MARRPKALEDAYNDGFDQGLKKGHRDIVDWLMDQYLGSDARPDRGTPEAEAILKLARRAMQHINEKERP